MPASNIDAAFHGLLDRTTPSSAETRALLRKARDIRYWEPIKPSSFSLRQQKIDTRAFGDAHDLMREEGYFQVPGVFSRASMRKMHAIVEAVRLAGWPPVFTMVYPEFWS